MSTGNRDLGPFEAARDLHYEAPFPTMLPVRQKFDAPQVQDVAAATREALAPLRDRVTSGMRVAITAGSRGIHDKADVVRATGEWLRSLGAEPFVVPAMGSHGGATAEGQVEMLRSLHMTEQSLGMPIRATMDTVELGRVEGGPMVHLDANAAEADGIIAVNRVKAHTDFTGELESGLGKIIAIGLGKQRGAEGIHVYGPANLGVWIPRVARRIIETGKVLGGLAIVENAYDRAAKVAFLGPDDIAGPGEASLLLEAKELMARLPFDDIDVAVVDQMGKNISGAGMDTNVIGRMMIRGSAEFRRRREVVVDGLNRIDGVSCVMPGGAFYAFPNVRGLGMPSDVLADRLLEEAGVACLAGTAFGPQGEGYLRLSYASSVENLRSALQAVEAYVGSLAS